MALTTGIASILAAVLIVLFYVIGGPFGTLNDIFNGVAGILSGALAWLSFSEFRLNSSANRIAMILALIGGVIVVIGSILIVYDITGWLLAGWYTTLGNAFIGIWLFTFSYFARPSNMLPHNISTFGMIVGAIMVVGIIVIPGIVMRIDSIESSPWFLNLGLLSYIGTYFLYPIWTIWLGRTLLSK